MDSPENNKKDERVRLIHKIRRFRSQQCDMSRSKGKDVSPEYVKGINDVLELIKDEG